MVKKLIASDYDGTFRCGDMTDFNIEIIRKWRKRGNYFGIVTGRGIDFFEKVKEVGIEEILDYLIVYNGAYIADMNGNVIYESFIPKSVFSELEKFFGRYNDIVHFDKTDETEDGFHQYYATLPSYEKALEVAKLANEKFGNKISAFVNGPHVNIVKLGSGKAESVKIILEHYGLKSNEVAVVGDDYNDLEMILCHHGWAMKSGKPDVVAQAEHTCESVGALAEELMK